MSEKVSVYWMRRDMRLGDNPALFHALNSGHPVLPLFILDENILEELPAADKRVAFIQHQLKVLQEQLRLNGGDIRVEIGKPTRVWQKLLQQFDIAGAFFNHDYEPYARERDQAIAELLAENGIPVFHFKDHVIFEKEEILKDDGNPYVVFTPYSKRWKAKLSQVDLELVHSENYLDRLLQLKQEDVPPLEHFGFESGEFEFPPKTISQKRIKEYNKTRDIPGIEGTSKLGIHFRFGTISIREKARQAHALSETFLNELIWRDFYHMILWHFPRVVQESFRKAYDQIEWRNDSDEYEAWCQGKTGYPIVDAGMRELNTTGYMHNRVRMIVASFLTKHLLIDWRWGELYFAQNLLDYDLASNNGGWQWAAGSGVDAAPYFRIFNPTLQADKFDKNKKYISRWVPEWNTDSYPQVIVEHKFARQRCLETYKKALN